MSTYVPLWSKSHYSFLQGASSPEEYIDTCIEYGLTTIAITDRDALYGVVRAHMHAQKRGVRLIAGAELTLEGGSRIVLLVQNKTGYQNLCRLISHARLRSPKGDAKLPWQTLCDHAGGLLALWGGDHSYLTDPHAQAARIEAVCNAFKGHIYAMITRHHLATDRIQEQRTRRRAHRFNIPLTANTEVLYHTPSRRDLQDVMTCIRHRCTLQNAGTRTQKNRAHALLSNDEFYARFSDAPGLIDATCDIAERCRFSLDTLHYVYPAETGPDGIPAHQWLRTLTFEGAQRRYPAGIPHDVRKQLHKELNLIEELDYGGYFLTMKELVDFCASRHILCQGRGSAANSAVCYCLGITAVDPVRMDLLFERFLSRERQEPPDIDLDIAHQRREEVIQHMYARYGRERAAMVSNIIRYRPRSAVRDVGFALGLSDAALDRLAKLLSRGGKIRSEQLQKAGLSPDSPISAHLLRLSNELLNAPRHLSIHPGGFILGSEPISNLVPVENGAMEGRTVIQWDKYAVEDMRLFKLDLLGLGALSQVDACLGLIQTHYGQHYSMATIPTHCRQTFDMLQRGDTIGVFQLESRAQMAMLPRLKPRCYYDIVIQISIVRPGPITGGMVHPYLRRRNHEEPITYPHPDLKTVLARTLGVPLFQEQVMKIAVIAADYTPGEADQLRRDMGAWGAEGRIERHHARFVQRMGQKGIEAHFAKRVFEQIKGFGEYGFPESHAASFALIAWATAWLRCHFPEAFTASLLNAQPMGFYSSSSLIQDARRAHIEIRPADVRASQWNATLETTGGTRTLPPPSPHNPEPSLHETAPHPRQTSAIRLGFRQIQGFREQDAHSIETARADAPFTSLEDFLQRVHLPESAALRLAHAGAFDGLGVSRRDAIWTIRHTARTTTLPMFPHEDPQNDAPDRGFAPLSAVESMQWDHQSMHLSAKGHMLEPFRAQLKQRNLPAAADVARGKNGQYVRYAGLIIVRQRPATASGVVFLTMEDETGLVNVIIWKRVWARYKTLLCTHSFLSVHGRLQQQGEVQHIIAHSFRIPRIHASLPAHQSHDFH